MPATQWLRQRFATSPVDACLIAFAMAAALMTSAGLLYWGVFRDDVLEAQLRRTSEMQQAYEDRVASLRAQVDRLISRQLLDQTTIEGRMRELLSRQALLESRSATIAALADQIGAGADTTSTIAQTPPASASPVKPPSRQAMPSEASAYATERDPAAAPSARSGPTEKPRPITMELRSSLDSPSPVSKESAESTGAPMNARLSAIGQDLEHIEREQVQAVARIGSSAKRKAARLSAIIREVGLSTERLAPKENAVGGPFEPLKAGPGGSQFDMEITRISADYQAAGRLMQIVPGLPLRRPLAGRPDITSGYGPRMDPFMGRMALHTGLDLREEAGALVRATGGGKVISAGWSGGYGNMVEIDHGNDLVTRYGHLSSISVTEGKVVAPGAILGRVGTTGRSTSAHLHYEVRVDGEAVDPGRFLRASDRMAELN